MPLIYPLAAVNGAQPKARVCMLLTNPCVNDSRVLREAQALAGAGHDVLVVATRAPGVLDEERRDGFRILRVPAEPALAELVRRTVSAIRRVLSRSNRDDGPAEPAAAPADQGIFGDEAWVAAAGPRSDGELLLRNPRGAVLRLGLRIFLTFRWWRFARSAWSAIRTERAEIYVAHDLDTLPIAALAKRRLGGRLVYDSHELYTDQTITPPPTRLWRSRWGLVERSFIGRADRVITVCDGIAEELVGRYRIERPAVLRNIPELGDGSNADQGLRERLRIDPDLKIAIYLGGIQLNRPLEHLIDAIAPLEKIALVLLGPGDPAYVAQLRARAERLGCADRVHIPGPVPPELVTASARDADVGLVVLRQNTLSEWYCLPSKLFESIQAGLPVIANDWPEVKRVVEGYGVGVLCEDPAPATVRAAIHQVLDDEAGYAEMQENARRARTELNWETESTKLLDLVRALA